MADRTLEERVTALETQMAGKTLEEHFREHGQLIDRLFAYRFGEMDKTLEPIRSDVATIKADVGSLKFDVASLKHDVGSLKMDVAGLKSDLGSVKNSVASAANDLAGLREAVKIILTRLT